MTMHPRASLSEEVRDRIAGAIRTHLAAKGISRKSLERSDLSKSTIDKALAGDFSDNTLAKIESILNLSFGAMNALASIGQPNNINKNLGGYTKELASEFEGRYLCIRPSFIKHGHISSYQIDISWDTSKNNLIFKEASRSDAKYTQSGDVYIPPGRPFFNLLTAASGSLRLITLSRPDEEGMARGILTTLNNPRGVIYTPVSAPVVLRRLKDGEAPAYGLLGAASEGYAEAAALIESVVAEDYAKFVTSAGQATDFTHSP